MSNLLLGLRLGDQPQLVITGTPKRKRVLVGLTCAALKRPGRAHVEVDGVIFPVRRAVQ